MPDPGSLIVLVLPGGEPEQKASTASVAAEGVPSDRVIDLESLPHDPALSAELIGFIRPGDSWMSGHLATHRSALAAMPDAGLSVARHRRRDPTGKKAIGEWGLG